MLALKNYFIMSCVWPGASEALQYDGKSWSSINQIYVLTPGENIAAVYLFIWIKSAKKEVESMFSEVLRLGRAPVPTVSIISVLISFCEPLMSVWDCGLSTVSSEARYARQLSLFAGICLFVVFGGVNISCKEMWYEEKRFTKRQQHWKEIDLQDLKICRV